MQKTKVILPAMIAIAILGAGVSQARQPGGASDATPDVTVALRCSVITTPGTIERAKQIARNMFASIGVTLAWRGEITSHDQGILIKAALESGLGDDEGAALGETYPFAASHEITIRYDRVRNAAGISNELEPLILAHVLVHEITHILQGVNRHSDTGIMKARWNLDDYCEMRWKPLEFTAEDVELIRLGMKVLRAKAEGAPQTGLAFH